MCIKDLEKLEKDISKWASSEDGKETIRKSVEDVERATDELNEARQIDPEILTKPFTV